MSTTTHPPFVPAADGDKRSPCPALNTLANHSYLPHDGKNISFWQLVQAIRSVYNLSFTLAAPLAVGGILLCGNGLRLDLDKLALHNRIEHDASLVRGNTLPGRTEAPIPVDQGLFHKMLSLAHKEGGLGLDGFAQLRVDGEAQLTSPLDAVHSEIGKGEAGLAWLLFKREDGRVPPSIIEQWYGEERIPEGWAPREKQIGLFEAHQATTKVGAKMEEIKRQTRDN